MNDVDRDLASLSGFRVPAPPSMDALRDRNRRRRGRRVAGVSTVVALAVAGGVGLSLIAGGSDEPDRDAVVAGPPDRATPPPDGAAPTPPTEGRAGVSSHLFGLDDLPRCDPALDGLTTLAPDVDPDGSLGVLDRLDDLVPAAPSAVLDRVPVDLRAAIQAACASAADAESGIAAITLQDSDGAVLYEALTMPDDGPLTPGVFDRAIPGAEYQQVGLGSAHPFVGYAQETGEPESAPTRILGVIEQRRFAARAPALPDAHPGAGIGQLVMVPPQFDRQTIDNELPALTPRHLPEGADLCLYSPFATTRVARWCSPTDDIAISIGERIPPIDGQPIDVNGMAGALSETAQTLTFQFGLDTGDHLHIEIPRTIERSEAVRIVASIPLINAQLSQPRTGTGDLRRAFSEQWLREVVEQAGLTPGHSSQSTETGSVTVEVSGGERTTIRLIAAPDWPVLTPPFASETIPIGEVDLLLSLPETPQAVGAFGCGQISWQLIGADQQPRQLIEEVTRAIVHDLDC